jgi:methylglutamate dehydrogenase subunit D
VLNAGIQLVERDALGLATVLARKGKSVELTARVRQLFCVELPREPRRALTGAIAFAATAPGAWLAMREVASADFASTLMDSLSGLASVSDQTDAFAVVRISGPKVREVLCKLVPLDLHARAFAVNQFAVTIIAHIPVTMWRLADSADGSVMFELATFRSFSDSFRQTLLMSAASV